MARCCFVADCNSISENSNFHKFQKGKSDGLVLLSSDGVTGMAYPQLCPKYIEEDCFIALLN